MITQERLDKLKGLPDELYMGEFVDAANEAIPELVKEIERMRAVVKDALEEAEKAIVQAKELAAKAQAVGINAGNYPMLDIARHGAIKRLADRLGVTK